MIASFCTTLYCPLLHVLIMPYGDEYCGADYAGKNNSAQFEVLFGRIVIIGRMQRSRKLEESSLLFNRTASNASLLGETTGQLFEREIDNYTRMLEQDKRRFFRLQENRSEVLRDHAQKAKELDALKSRAFKTETMKLQAELKILERELNQTINSYNDVLALNKSFKGEIEELRKEKINQKEAQRRLTLRIEELSALVTGKQGEIQQKKERFAANKQQILRLKAENENEAKDFREEVGAGRGNLELSRSGHLFKRKSEMEQKNEATDTQPLVKYRLRQLITQNKERVRIVENYRKTMAAIWKSFEEIKEESGTGDLEEITSAFLKHEQQNHFIYEYINKLNKEIDDLTDNNSALALKIAHQKELNQMHAEQLGVTPDKTRAREANERFELNCAQRIAEFEALLRDSTPVMADLRAAFGLEGEQELTQFNLQHQLSQIEELIGTHFPSEEVHVGLKEEATKYTRAPPALNQEIRDKEERLFDGDKLREYASDYWEKRKAKAELK